MIVMHLNMRSTDEDNSKTFFSIINDFVKTRKEYKITVLLKN